MMSATETAVYVPHPRATWLDPATGGEIPWRDLLARLADRRVVLLGETHDIAEIHRWQLHVAVALHTLRPNLALGFEMFPCGSSRCSTTGSRA